MEQIISGYSSNLRLMTLKNGIITIIDNLQTREPLEDILRRRDTIEAMLKVPSTHFFLKKGKEKYDKDDVSLFFIAEMYSRIMFCF